MDELSKFRLTGAAIWLGLLVMIVPNWYNNPVHFKPEGHQIVETSAERPLVEHIYTLPTSERSSISTPTVPRSVATANPKMAVDAKAVAVKETIYTDKSKPLKATPKQWIVRIIAYKDIRKANDLLGKLETDYDVYIKRFEGTGTYSVRTGPYRSKAQAEKDSQKLDRKLHTQSEVVQLN
ncbi:MAG: SPOR domain-containing protein [Gammaproteobacteria bacterium]|nr:SPOR domain-containing protein [Gammaproteobacteria bacterium]